MEGLRRAQEDALGELVANGGHRKEERGSGAHFTASPAILSRRGVDQCERDRRARAAMERSQRPSQGVCGDGASADELVG